MKEFPQHQFLVVDKLKQSATSSTFLVKPQIGTVVPRILKLYSGPSVRVKLLALENDLSWQTGLAHPHLAGIISAGISGKSSFFTTRQFSDIEFEPSGVNPTQIPQLLDAVSFLHTHARIHGRVKPSNILIVDNSVRLADLRLMDNEGSSDLDNIRFTAPEVLGGDAPTFESDFYSVGAILYRMYAKRDPFDDSIPENLKAKYLHARIPPIQTFGGIREPVARAIDGLLHRNPRRRMTAFEELIREFPSESTPVSRVPMIGRRGTMELLQSQVGSRTATTLNVCLVEGDAGIGKSRLIEELKFRSSFQHSQIYSIACINQAERSLTPIIKLVGMVLEQKCRIMRTGSRQLLGSFAANLASLFEDSGEGSSSERFDRPDERIVQDLVGLIASFSRKESLRLCIEDVDRAEPATLGFLRQMCFRAAELNVRLIVTCRNSSDVKLLGEMEALLGGNFIRTTLDRLTRTEARDLVQYLESKRAKQTEIVNRADGNPLWMLEYARNESSQALAASLFAVIREEMSGVFLKLVHVLALYRAPASAEVLSRVVALDIGAVRQKLLWLRKIGAVHESNEVFEMRMDELRSAITSKMSSRARRTTHQAIYEILQTVDEIPEESLAEHAFHGGLWNQAAVHFTTLAHNAVKRGDNVGAVIFYEGLTKIFRQLNQTLPSEVEIAIATCLAKTGKLRLADQIYMRLVASSEIKEDLRIRLSLIYRGGDIDCTHLYERLAYLRQAIESSKSGQFHDSILLSRLCNASVRAGDLVGAADALDQAHRLLETRPDKNGEMSARSAKGFLLMNRGDFKNASETYRTLSCESWNEAAAALTNRGVCLEHLGNIRSATVIQKRAYRYATKAGHLVGQFLCLGNLGVFNAKLGNFKDARDHFAQVNQLVVESGTRTGISFKGVEAEEAVLQIFEGQHQRALHRLRNALNSTASLKSTKLQCRLLECEILSLIGADVTAADIEQIAIEGSWSPSPLYAVQLALLRSRTKPSLSEALPVLDAALNTAQRASLLYETCRLELEISARLHEADPIAAKPHVEAALTIAKKNGYRPLQARALLLRGLCGQHDKERAHYLDQSFKLASEVGVPEIVSESAYHLGVLHQTMKQHASAREFLAISTRVATDIADRIPAQFRTKYLDIPWRKDGRTRYAESLQDQPVRMPSAESGIPARDHHYFRALYRIGIAAASAQTVDAFIRELLPAIALPRDSIVAMLKFGEQTTWHSLGVAVNGELRQRVLQLASKSRDRVRFNSNDRWIPFQGLQHSGGIYVVNRRRNQVAEDEMEFFTILGTFVSSALDQIHNRAVSRPAAIALTDFHGIVGNSRAIRELCAHIETISNNNATVLIQGETGAGKELVARAIHKLSARSKAPFIAIDCGAIPEGLMESELFGSKRGSFTGAVADRAGVFEAAHSGTLFLDEISNMNFGMQAKLLRVLQEREIRRVGETRSRPIDVRLIAASNTNLKQLVAGGTFRQDLLFRLNVIDVQIPPLRARREDIPVLAAHFLNQLNVAQNTSKAFAAEALHPLLAHSFPGNIRELQNSVERAYFTASGRTISSIPIDSFTGDDPIDDARKWLADLAEGRRNFWTAVHDRYKRRDIPREKVVALIDLGLRATRGSYKKLASLLHIDRTEYRRLMDFLRRNDCLLDFRPYRKVASIS